MAENRFQLIKRSMRPGDPDILARRNLTQDQATLFITAAGCPPDPFYYYAVLPEGRPLRYHYATEK